MAQMIPTKIGFRESPAEMEMFERLRDDLSAQFTVLHHVPWASPDNRRRTVEGEADFVVVHPDFGALVVEVKGGTLRFDAATSRWYQTSRGQADEHLCADPFRQAANGARALAEFLHRLPNFRRGWGPIGHAVAFPDAVFSSPPTPSFRRELVIDARDLAGGSLEERITAAIQWHSSDLFQQGADGARRLVAALNHDVTVEQPLGIRAGGVERAIARLSDQQYRILRYLKHRRRLAVSGPAGSGKTLLALERARDAARSGDETLLVTYNRPLADFLSNQTRGTARLTVCNFHQLCRLLGEMAHVPIPRQELDFYGRAVEIALEALDRTSGRFDAVVVDEGQVFEEEWWIVLEAALRDAEAGLLWVFYDDNQALYQRPRGLPDGMDTQPLSESWRNSRPIFEAAMRYYEGGVIECLGPDGPDVEFVQPTSTQRKTLSRVLHRLVNEQHVATDDIVVLTARSVATSEVVGEVGAYRLGEAPTRKNDVRLSSIRRFLGLEASVVVLAELPPASDPDFQSLMYVGMSRARAHLIVLQPSTD